MDDVRPRTFALAACLAAVLVGEGLLLAPRTLAAQPATQDVEGQVKDTSGAVVPRASVTLKAASGSFRRDAATDAVGRYRFLGVPQGAYLLTVFRDGFAPVTQELAVGPSGPASREVTLSPASFSEEITVAFTGTHSTSLKIDMPVRDIPVSVQSYTSSFLRAIDATTTGDLFNYTIGISRLSNDNSGFMIRGFRALSSGQNLQYNGLPGLSGRFSSPPTVNIERVEVLKGPASVLYGQAAPGGIINLVTKRPQAERAYLVDVRGGTFFGRGPAFGDADKGYFATDLTGPIDHDRKLLYRVIASYSDENSFRDFVQNKDTYIVPSLSWLGWSGWVVNLELEYRRLRRSWDDGLMAPNNDISLAPAITTRYQEPDDEIREHGRGGTLSINKSLAGGVTWNTTWRSIWHNDERQGYANVAVQGFKVTRRDDSLVNARRYHFLDTTLLKPMATGSVRHRLLFGVNAGYELNDFDRRQRATSPTLTVDIYHPVYGTPGRPLKPDTHHNTNFKTYAVYLNDQVELTPKLKALAGLRATHNDSRDKELRIAPTVTDKSAGAVLPMAGLVFQPDHVWSFYSSFSTSFLPPDAGLEDANGENSFKPERSRQYEAGVKAAIGNGRGEAALALFDIKKRNVIVSLGGGVSAQFGQELSRGVEASLSHRILDNWQVILGYTFVDAKIIDEVIDPNQPTAGGKKALLAPKHSGNLWTRYDVPRGTLHGLGLGLGLVYSDDRVGTLPTGNLPRLLLPNYLRVDGGVYYVRPRYEVTATIGNVFDKLYYESASARGILPGAPRAATVSLRFKF